VVNPIVSPVTAEVSLFTEEADPVPETVDQVPVSLALGAFAASVPEVVLQRFCVGPAEAIVVVESEVMVTSEVVGAHPPNPAVIVHLSTVVSPTESPVTAEVSEFTEDADPVPDTVDHVPVSEAATALAARTEAVALQRSWSDPAAATVVVGSTLIVTSEVVGAHPANPAVMVHLRTVVPPMVSPETVEVLLFTASADPDPDTVVHVPVSEPASALAASVPEVVLQRFCVGPAAATVVVGSTLMVTSDVVGAQPAEADVMVHLKTVVPPMVSPVTADVGLLTDEADPEPETVDHVPVSLTLGVLAARVEEVVLHRFCTGPAAATVVVVSEVTVIPSVPIHPLSSVTV
jgi:hypothetical protein